MTSRKMPEARYQDQLDVMIHWALQEGATECPPPEAWERISERVEREVEGRRARWWRRFRVACTSAALWFVDSAVGPPSQFLYCERPELSEMRERYYLCLLMYQNDLPMLLGQPV